MALEMPFLLLSTGCKKKEKNQKKKNGLGRLQITKSDSLQTLPGEFSRDGVGENYGILEEKAQITNQKKISKMKLQFFPSPALGREGKSFQLSDGEIFSLCLSFLHSPKKPQKKKKNCSKSKQNR